MCPPDFAVKNITLREDKFQPDPADKADTLDISGWQHNIDLKYIFAGLRKGEGKRESLALGDVLLEELGEAKGEYEGTIADAAYVNFELFMLYSGFDSYRLMQLENKNGDIDTVHMMANKLSHTRHSKVMRKTISIRNLAAKQFATKGLILSNNQNAFIEHEDFGKFKGAFVAQATKVAKVGVMFNGERSTTVFDDTVDEDFTGLYPAIIRAYQIADSTLIGKVITDNETVNERLGELINEGDILIMGELLFGLPSMSQVLDDLEEFMDFT